LKSSTILANKSFSQKAVFIYQSYILLFILPTALKGRDAVRIGCIRAGADSGVFAKKPLIYSERSRL
jgi:hypothetical protein